MPDYRATKDTTDGNGMLVLAGEVRNFPQRPVGKWEAVETPRRTAEEEPEGIAAEGEEQDESAELAAR